MEHLSIVLQMGYMWDLDALRSKSPRAFCETLLLHERYCLNC